MSRKVFSFLNNFAVGGTLLLRSREIDGMKFAQSVKAVNCILQRATAETAEVFSGASTRTIEAITPYLTQVMVAPETDGW